MGGSGVAVGGSGVAVGGSGVAVGGSEVGVGGSGVAVGGSGVAVGDSGVAVGGSEVGLGEGAATIGLVVSRGATLRISRGVGPGCSVLLPRTNHRVNPEPKVKKVAPRQSVIIKMIRAGINCFR